jgi:hypothetical protein
VNNIAGISPSFPGITGDGTYYGYHNTFTNAIGVTLTGTVPSEGGETYSLQLYKNGSQIDCINITTTGSFSFGSHSFMSTDIINIQMTTGSC